MKLTLKTLHDETSSKFDALRQEMTAGLTEVNGRMTASR